MLQEAAVGGCNSGGNGGGYNVNGCNSSSGYNINSYTMVARNALRKQLCWEFGVTHNCICIISEGPLMYIVTSLETLCSQKILLVFLLDFS